MTKIIFTLFFLFSSAMADIPPASVARTKSTEALQREAKFERAQTWTYIEESIKDAIARGDTTANVQYRKEMYPEFEKRLKSLGYKTKWIGPTTLSINW